MKYVFKLFILMMMVAISCGLFLNQPIKAADNEELVLMFSSGGSGDTLANSAKEFGKITGIKTKVLLYTAAELRVKQTLALSQKNSIPDVIAVNDNLIAEMEEFLPNLDVSQNKLDSFVPAMKDVFQRPPGSNNYIALPVRMSGNCIIYREDIFKENNIDPKDIVTWEDYLEIAKKLTKPEEKQWAYADAFTPYSSCLSAWINFIYSYNADVLTSDRKKAAFNTENGIKATQMMVDLLNEVSPPGSINYEYGDLVEALNKGSVVMTEILSSRYAEINSLEFPHHGKFKILPNFPYGANTGLQSGQPTASGWGLGINPYSQNKEAAMKFIEFITSEEEQLRLAIEQSNSPTTKSVFSDPAYLKAIPEGENIKRAFDAGKPRPLVKGWTEVETIIGLQLQKALIGEITVKEALVVAEEEVNKFFEEK